MKSKKLIITGSIVMSLIVIASGFYIYKSQSNEEKNKYSQELIGSIQITEQSLQKIPDEISSQTNEEIVKPQFSIQISPPDDSVEMQVGWDPAFNNNTWREIEETVNIKSNNYGYQTLFARFKRANGEVTQPTVKGLIISDEINKNPIKWIRPLSPKHLLVHIEPSFTILGSGKNQSMNWAQLSTEELNQPWRIISNENTQSIKPISVLSRGIGAGRKKDAVTTKPEFDVLIEVPKSNLGNDLKLVGPKNISADYQFKDQETITPAIQVNQIGWNPVSSKYAYLGGWYQKIDFKYNDLDQFDVVNNQTNQIVYQGQISLSAKNDKTNPVYRLDFSKLEEPGSYKICVKKIGCSYEFQIEERVYDNLTNSIARAMYHQRSGIELQPPFTPIKRPAPRNPDESNFKIKKTNISLLEAERIGYKKTFEEIVTQDTGEVIENTPWGGHHDAGDWDRRIQHLWYARMALNLVQDYPEYEKRNLNIPESTNQIPDFIDEGLWTLDLYERMQTEQGAISGGIEASNHPKPKSTSWNSDLQLYQFKPDPWSSYIYASVAAEYAKYLKKIDEDLANRYETSAIKSMEWAQNQPLTKFEKSNKKINEQRAVAAISLYSLTSDKKWHTIFLNETEFKNKSIDYLNCHEHSICDAAWIYSQLPDNLADQTVKKNVVKSFINNAENQKKFIDSQAYNWSLENPYVPKVWGLGMGGVPKNLGLLRAYKLTKNKVYLDAAQASASSSLGANPLNQVYITGFGKEPVKYPLIVDSINGEIPVWQGTPIYGNHQIQKSDSWYYQYVLEPEGIRTNPITLDYMWQYQDTNFPAFNEYTVHQNHANSLYIFGSLAAN